jgi:hypothetical protein
VRTLIFEKSGFGWVANSRGVGFPETDFFRFQFMVSATKTRTERQKQIPRFVCRQNDRLARDDSGVVGSRSRRDSSAAKGGRAERFARRRPQNDSWRSGAKATRRRASNRGCGFAALTIKSCDPQGRASYSAPVENSPQSTTRRCGKSGAQRLE